MNHFCHQKNLLICLAMLLHASGLCSSAIYAYDAIPVELKEGEFVFEGSFPNEDTALFSFTLPQKGKVGYDTCTYPDTLTPDITNIADPYASRITKWPCVCSCNNCLSCTLEAGTYYIGFDFRYAPRNVRAVLKYQEWSLDDECKTAPEAQIRFPKKAAIEAPFDVDWYLVVAPSNDPLTIYAESDFVLYIGIRPCPEADVWSTPSQTTDEDGRIVVTPNYKGEKFWISVAHDFVKEPVVKTGPYTLYIGGEVSCEPGKFTLDSFLPLDNATLVDWETTPVIMNFSCKVDPESVNDNTIHIVTDTADGKRFTEIPDNCTVSGTTVTCKPKLEPGKRYDVHLNRGEIKSTSGERLSDGYQWYFTTMPKMNIKIIPVQVVEDVDLVKGKSTVVRVKATWSEQAKYPDVTYVPANVTLSCSDGTIFIKENCIFYHEKNSVASKDFIKKGRSINFYSDKFEITFPIFYGGTYSLHAEVEPIGQNADEPKVFTGDQDVVVRQWAKWFLTRSDNFRTYYTPVAVGDWKTGDPPDITSLATKNDLSLRKLYPVYTTTPTISKTKTEIEPFIQDPIFYQKKCLRNLAMINWFGTYNVVVGIAPDKWMIENYNAPGVHANYIPGFTTYAVLMSNTSSSTIAPHEIGHVCGIDDEVDPKISPGYDLIRDRYIDSSVPNELEVKGKNEGWTCLMDQNIAGYIDGYNADVWISKASYQTLLNLFTVNPRSQSRLKGKAAEFGNESEDRLFITGDIAITNGQETAHADAVYILKSPAPLSPSVGDYAIELQDSNGAVLEKTSFTPEFETAAGGVRFAVFVESVLFDEATEHVVIKHGNSVLLTLPRTAHAPTLNISSPSSSQTLSGQTTVSWNAADADGDSLKYTLSCSPDNGNTWDLIALDLTKTDYDLDTTQLKNSTTYKIKVVANDGFNTTEALSGVFAINNPPAVIATVPENNATDVPYDTSEIIIRFKDAMDKTTLTSSSVYLEDESGSPISGSVLYHGASHEVTLVLDQRLVPKTTYTGWVMTDVKDETGTALPGLYSWSFTTGDDYGSGSCPATALLGSENKTLLKLRAMRDAVLSNSSDGKKLVSIYYRNAAELTDILIKNQNIMKMASSCLYEVLPALDNLIKNRRCSFDAAAVQHIEQLMDLLIQHASPSLAKDLKELQKKYFKKPSLEETIQISF
ncbi:MAG: Ig-like domain-containing protein [Desulfobacterota bacterium]|nr:Ig-like domain-containing protein [Thermodesulfobacteriota bacterium]